MGNSTKENNVYQRLQTLFDDGTFTEIDAYAKGKTDDVEVVAGYGYVNGVNCYAFCQNSEINSGAITVAQCSKIKKIYDLATKTGCPIIGIYDSNGVMLSDGFEVLNSFGDIVKSATSVSGVVPQISIIAGACLGTSALMANMADVVIATKDSDFYVTTPSEVSIDELSKEGAVDVVANDVNSAVEYARNIVALLPENNLCSSQFVDFDFVSPNVVASDDSSIDEIVSSIADNASLLELKENYGKNVKIFLSTVEGNTVGIVAFIGDLLCPACAYKAEGFVKFCDAFNIPLITIANSCGLKKNAESQMLVAITKLTSAYATVTCPKISLITSKSIGTAYITLAGKGANADITLAYENAVVSPLDVEAAVAFLYNERLANGEDRQLLEKEYEATIGSSYGAAACGAIDDVIIPSETREKIVQYLNLLSSKRENTIPRKHSVK